jgi:hypothetical protein
MNPRTNRPTTSRLRTVWRCLGFCLGWAMTCRAGTRYLVEFGEKGVQVQPAQASEPYLCTIGAPPLRFRETIRLPEPEDTKPVATRPTDSSKASKANPPGPQATASAPAPKAPEAVVTEAHSGNPAGSDAGQPSIIPDEMRPRVRTEEFLPFFQLPGPGGAAVPPAQPPASPPRSSATYEQK